MNILPREAKFTFTDPRMALIVEIALVVGLRVSEIACLKADQFYDGPWIKVKVKRGKVQDKFVPAGLHEHILDYLQGRRLGWLFPKKRSVDHMSRIEISNSWRAIANAAGYPGVRFHDLRHTAGTWFFEDTGNIVLTRDFMGHDNVKTTSLYVHVDKHAIEEAQKGRLMIL